MRVFQLRKCEVHLVTSAAPYYMRRYGKVKGECNSIQRRNQRAGGADASRVSGKGEYGRKGRREGTAAGRMQRWICPLCGAERSIRPFTGRHHRELHITNAQSPDARGVWMEVLNYIIRRPTCPSISMNKIVSPLAEGIGRRKRKIPATCYGEARNPRPPCKNWHAVRVVESSS